MTPQDTSTMEIANDPELTTARIIKKANETFFIGEQRLTPVTIKFMSENTGEAIKVAEKHVKLYHELRKIDETLLFLNEQKKAFDEPDQIPIDKYTQSFEIDTKHRREGTLYVQCYI